MQGRGTVVTGRVEQGTIKTGEEVEVLGLMQVSCHHMVLESTSPLCHTLYMQQVILSYPICVWRCTLLVLGYYHENSGISILLRTKFVFFFLELIYLNQSTCETRDNIHLIFSAGVLFLDRPVL